MDSMLRLVAYGEILLWIAAFHVFFFHHGNSFAESASYALISTLMLFSFVFQISFIIGYPHISVFLESILTIVAIAVVFKHRGYYKRFAEIIRFVVVKQSIAFLAILAVFCYLGFLACTTVPEIGYEDIFKRIMTFDQHRTFFIQVDSQESSGLFTMNTPIISYLFLRVDSQIGTGIFGFISYLSIGFSTYALSRRYAWPDTAFTVTLMTLSLTRLVFLSTTPGIEIIPAAVSLLCILAIYRALEQPDIRDMIVLLLGIFFSISEKLLFWAFPVILIVLSCVLFVRRHGRVTWTSLLMNHWKISMVAVIPALIFSQAWLFAYNFHFCGNWTGPYQISTMPIKDNVLLGAIANLVRYFFESLQLTWPLNALLSWVLGFSFNGLLIKIYNLLFFPLFGTNGASTPFVLSWIPSGQLSWFGPLGIIFIVPAIMISIFRAHRRLKAIAIALAGYVYVVALVVAWKPGNAEFFTIVFTCGGFCVSFLLPPWRFTSAGKKILQIISIMLLVYVCLFNANKPLLKLPEIFGNLPPYQTLESVHPKEENKTDKFIYTGLH